VSFATDFYKSGFNEKDGGLDALRGRKLKITLEAAGVA